MDASSCFSTSAGSRVGPGARASGGALAVDDVPRPQPIANPVDRMAATAMAFVNDVDVM
jgi:hypothetical protein